ncbi:MAG: hypothetical protein RML93_02780 [Anaerolineales bacterium]|nr:hypothetical protein [Anaerolineales bacterium]MCS7246676.1 hypothetical protein [Anaerolineales bacterium]MDW8160486.1 hypothetical protein [Anaerolineales bacterium]MDW8446199.1 hypothetical protein [Anaerolineales bacterium]
MKPLYRFAQAYKITPWRKQVSSGMLILVGLLGTILAASLYLDVTARTLALGRAILIMENEIREVEMLNAHLRTQLGILTSSAVMEKRALEMGFRRIDPGEATYLIVPGYVPLDQSLSSSTPRKTQSLSYTLPSIYRQSLLEWLKIQLDEWMRLERDSSP